MIMDMFLSVFVDGCSNSELRDTLVMTYARLLVQASKTVKAVSNTAIKWLAAICPEVGEWRLLVRVLLRTLMRG
jgi:hypothetical protein